MIVYFGSDFKNIFESNRSFTKFSCKRITFLVVLSFKICMLLLWLTKFSYKPPNVYLDPVWDDGKTLQEISHNKMLKRSPTNVFFHETSITGNGVIGLTARQACAIESTALLNPDHDLFLLYTSQVGFRNTSRIPLIDAILSYQNVNINFLNLTRYVEDTPLKKWLASRKLFRSKYLISHTSDVLRFLSLWKYSGTYLDLDIISLSSLDAISGQNIVAAEDDEIVGSAILHFEGADGKKIADLCVKEIAKHFLTEDWGSNGPKLITRVAESICRNSNVKDMVYDNKCRYSLNVLPVEMCFSIPYEENEKFFKEENLDEVLYRLSGSLITHVWNKLSADFHSTKNSSVAYMHLAKKYCPKTFQVAENF